MTVPLTVYLGVAREKIIAELRKAGYKGPVESKPPKKEGL